MMWPFFLLLACINPFKYLYNIPLYECSIIELAHFLLMGIQTVPTTTSTECIPSWLDLQIFLKAVFIEMKWGCVWRRWAFKLLKVFSKSQKVPICPLTDNLLEFIFLHLTSNGHNQSLLFFFSFLSISEVISLVLKLL